MKINPSTKTFNITPLWGFCNIGILVLLILCPSGAESRRLLIFQKVAKVIILKTNTGNCAFVSLWQNVFIIGSMFHSMILLATMARTQINTSKGNRAFVAKCILIQHRITFKDSICHKGTRTQSCTKKLLILVKKCHKDSRIHNEFS